MNTSSNHPLLTELKHYIVTCEPLTGDYSLSIIPQIKVNDDKIVSSLSNINSTLSSIPNGSFLVAIVGALSSVIAAFLFNVIYWKVIDVKKRVSSEVAKIEIVLDRFEKTATEYWMYPYNSQKAKGILIKEMRMKADLRLLRDSQKKISNQLFRQITRTQFNTTMNHLIGDLYDGSTGGDFEATQRKADLKRCGEIIRLCTQIRVEAAGVDR
jgi:hypothetical protein